MRIELDKPLNKTKLRQILKMVGNEGKEIKVIMGTEIFDIDTVVTKNGTIYLCTDSKSTSEFYEKRVKDIVDEEDDTKVDDYQDPRFDTYKNYVYTINFDGDWKAKWADYIKRYGLTPVDCPWLQDKIE